MGAHSRPILPLGVFLGLACAGCGGEPAPTPPGSALLITLDTTRADVLGIYGGPKGITPNLDRIAAEGLRYTRAQTVAPLTLPAHSSMLTGLYPPRHRVRDNGIRPLPGSASTLAERAREKGLRTAAFVAAAVLDDTFGLNQGFELYVDPERTPEEELTHFEELSATQVVDAALEWAETLQPGERFFAWVHLFDAHGPYEPPADLSLRFRRNPYHGEVAYADREIGRLMDTLAATGRLDDTTVLVVADHGEAFGEHLEISHGSYCYQTTMQVPFLVRYPDGYGAGEVREDVVSVVDVHPTLAEAMGLLPAPDIDGLSLLRRRSPAGRGVYFESYNGYMSYGWSPLAGWLDGQGKYLHSSRPQFFDLDEDPEESRDRIGEEDVERYRSALARVFELDVLPDDAEATIDEELRRKIQDLGYAAMGDIEESLPHPLDPSDRPSPAERAEEQAETLRAIHLIDIKLLDQAIPIFESVLAGNPDNLFALDKYAYCLVQRERFEEALPHLERLTREGPGWAGSYFNLGLALDAVGRTEEALAPLSRALELDPANPLFRQTLEAVTAELE